jgi:hypothetical protein
MNSNKPDREDSPAVEGTNGNPLVTPNISHLNPLVMPNGTRLWLIGHDGCVGELHREDGPAIELPDGTCKYYFRGKPIRVRSLEEFKEAVRLTIIGEVMES